MNYLFDAPKTRLHVIPSGIEEVFLNSTPDERGLWLVCTATITERKRVLELAQAAVISQTPLWVIGKPYSETDGYAQSFIALARHHPNVVRYDGPISNRAELARIYRQARGFVLLSAMESRSLSSEEAAASPFPSCLA